MCYVDKIAYASPSFAPFLWYHVLSCSNYFLWYPFYNSHLNSLILIDTFLLTLKRWDCLNALKLLELMRSVVNVRASLSDQVECDDPNKRAVAALALLGLGAL